MEKSKYRVAFKWLARLFALLCLVFIFRMLSEQWPSVKAELNPSVLQAALLASACMVVHGLLGAEIWHQLMSGARPTERRLTWPIFLTTQIAKYLPGNWGVFVGRTALAGKHGFEKKKVLGSILLETLAMMTFTFAFAAFFMHGYLEKLYTLGKLPALPPQWLLALPALGAVLAFPYAPKVLNMLFAKAGVKSGVFPSLPLKRYPLLAGCYFAQFLLMGLAGWLVLESFAPNAGIDFTTLAGVNAIAMLAGWTIPGAPAGLGIREAILLLLFSQTLGQTSALLLATLGRFVTIFTDLLLCACAYWFVPREKVESSLEAAP